MAAGRFTSWVRSSSVGAWVVLALTVIVPLIAFLVVLRGDADLVNRTCTPGLLFRGLIGIPCSTLRIASFVVSAAGAFVVIVLVWWLLTELIGLRRIFEVPWFGVGDDVENVGVGESIVRAGLFVVVVWTAIGLSALAYMGMSGGTFEMREEKPPDATSPRSSAELAPMIAAADKLSGEVKGIRDQLASRPQPASTDLGIAPQLQRLGEGLRDIQGILTSQDRKLDALRQIDGRSTRGEQERNDAAIFDEAKRLSGTVGEVRTLLEVQGRRLAVLDDIDRLLRDLDIKQVPAITGEIGNMTGAVAEVQRRVRAQTDVIERLEPLLKQRPPDPPPVDPPPRPNETSCLDRVDDATRKISATAAPRRYGRTLLVFFDKSGSQLTPGAGESLRELADELKRVEQPAVFIYGSADAQGDPSRSAQYAEQRAQVVKQFLERNVPQLSVQTTSARSTDEPSSEPYNRIARVEARGICP
jgi:outer membrane protein OmpA-like peptidoglycan-associated protein